jgi:hypothetical protein
MAMLRHKETGELFIYTDLLANHADLELVQEDTVAATVAAVLKEQSGEDVKKSSKTDKASLDDSLAAALKG